MFRFSFSLLAIKLHKSPIFKLPLNIIPKQGKQNTKVLAMLSLSSLLAACGGGGGSGNFSELEQLAESTQTGSSASAETLRIGNGTGDNFTESALSAAKTDIQAGESTLITFSVVTQDNNAPQGPWDITVSSPCIAGGLSSISTPGFVTNGQASFDYTAAGCSGMDTVTVRLIPGSGGGTATTTINVPVTIPANSIATVDLNVQPPEVLTVSFAGSTLDQLSLAGIGGDESTEVSFRVSGPQDVPIIGADVTFSVNSGVGGAAILEGRDTGTTDNNGEVRTILKSGTVAGPVSVLAEHNATGLQGRSDDIIISTGVPESSRFSVSYGNFNPSSAFNVDGITVNINIIASDQFGNNPIDGTRVSFVAPESGNVVNSCELTDGACSAIWRSTSPRPADNRLEIIAYTDGAEDFVDNNGNSVFDAGDGAVIDLSEPYADENEDGDYDLGEFFFDSNQNGVWDTGNGEWDGPCLTKVDATAVCDGQTTVSIFDTVTVVMSSNSPRLLSLGNFGPTGTNINILQASNVSRSGIIVADNNVNADILGSNPMPFGTTIAFTVEADGVSILGASSFEVANTTGPTGPYGITLKADEVLIGDPLPIPGLLFLTITPPDAAPTQFSWGITVTN